MTRRGVKRTMRLHVKCPNCSQPLFGTKTEIKTATLTEVTYECRNDYCGMRFVYNVEASRILQKPSVLINTQMNVKLSPVVEKTDKAMADLPISDDKTDLKMIEEAMPQGDMFYTQAANDVYGTPPRPPDKHKIKELAHSS